MKIAKCLSASSLVFLLSACGGGSPEADVASFSIIPSDFTHFTTCPVGGGGGVVDAVSIHTINGGLQPFRLRVTVSGLEVGLTNANNEFVPTTRNSEGDVILFGRDPKFAVRANLGCGSSVSVDVLDNTSTPASVTIKVENAS